VRSSTARASRPARRHVDGRRTASWPAVALPSGSSAAVWRSASARPSSAESLSIGRHDAVVVHHLRSVRGEPSSVIGRSDRLMNGIVAVTSLTSAVERGHAGRRVPVAAAASAGRPARSSQARRRLARYQGIPASRPTGRAPRADHRHDVLAPGEHPGDRQLATLGPPFAAAIWPSASTKRRCVRGFSPWKRGLCAGSQWARTSSARCR